MCLKKRLFVICAILLASFILYIQHDNIFQLSMFITDKQTEIPHLKIILLWTTLYNSHSNWKKFIFKDQVIRNKCPHCLFTSDRTLLKKADGILFQEFLDNLNYSDLPAYRSPNQRWILFLREPPTNPLRNLTNFNNLFNWTMSYREDSDVFGGYGDIQLEWTNNNPSMNINYAAKKGKLVAWFVSHCQTNGKRENYINQLSMYIPIDIYGNCGNSSLKCPRSDIPKCHKMLEEKYKFYLSFENSLCKNYVTEKFYDMVLLNIVPITFNYDQVDIVSEDGYINALKYKNPKDLAKLITQIDQNDSMYNEFFNWKRGKMVNNNVYAKLACDLCSKLQDSLPVKWYSDLNDWWNDQSKCHYWQDEDIKVL